MSDLTAGFIAPSRNAVPALLRAVPELSPDSVETMPLGWSGTITQTWRDGKMVGIKATGEAA